MSHLSRRITRLAGSLLLVAATMSCGTRDAPPRTPSVVFAAGSLARPLRAALDTIAANGGPTVALEIMGSREMLRAVTSLGRTPDLIVTADADEMERTLMPTYVTSSTTFARNRVVLALSRTVATRESVTTANWADVVSTGRLRIARTDPARAPLGYRTQLVWQLAESALQRPGLAARLARASPDALQRGNESDLAALLESGDADAAWCYESLARALGLSYVTLGDAIDLGSDADSLRYRAASVRVTGDAPGDSLTIRGTPIRYAVAVLANGRDVVGATVLRERLLDPTSVRIMRRIGLDMLDAPRVVSVTGPPRRQP